MRYLKNLNNFFSIKENKKEIKEDTQFLIENVNFHRTTVKELGQIELPDPKHGDFKLSVMPFENNGTWVFLPDGFKLWEKAFNDILKKIPLQENANTHYLTIDTKFFTNDEFLRREGVHIDGNFCVDPYFGKMDEKSSWGGASYDDSSSRDSKSSWGGASHNQTDSEYDFDGNKTSWGGASHNQTDSEYDFDGNKTSWGGASHKKSRIPQYRMVRGEDGILKMVRESQFTEYPDNSHVKMDWVLPYDITIPISEYVSGEKGGILTVSTEVGCQAWNGNFYGEVLSEGSFEKMQSQLTDDRKIIFEKNQLYFMSSNTPHETLLINKGKRRTFLRITLNHNYNNKNII